MGKTGFHLIGPNGEEYNPTLQPSGDFDPVADSERLYKAMKGFGTDEDAIVDVLSKRTSWERIELKDAFKANYGKDLVKELKSELSGNFESIVKMMMYDVPYMLAESLYHAIKGIGTKENVIIEVLCTSTNEEIEQIKEAYREVLIHHGNSDLSQNLETDLMGDLSGNFERVMVALLQARRPEPTLEAVRAVPVNGIWSIVDRALVEADIAELYNAGEGKLGTDEEVFVKLFCNRSCFHLAAIAKLYEEQIGSSILDAIEGELSGDFKSAIKWMFIACVNRPLCFARLLKRAMKGAGTDDKSLMRIIVRRAEIDLKEIMEEFEKDNNGETLEQWVKGDTSGDYKHMLLALMGKPWKK